MQFGIFIIKMLWWNASAYSQYNIGIGFTKL